MLRRAVLASRVVFVGRRGFNDSQRKLLEEEKTFLSSLPRIVDAAGANETEQRMVRDARLQLDELFLVVVVGEFNAGKVSSPVVFLLFQIHFLAKKKVHTDQCAARKEASCRWSNSHHCKN
jgi:hypothetical protein